MYLYHPIIINNLNNILNFLPYFLLVLFYSLLIINKFQNIYKLDT